MFLQEQGVDMLTGQFKLVGPHPHATVASERFEPFSDEELLDQFLNRDDETAEASKHAIQGIPQTRDRSSSFR